MTAQDEIQNEILKIAKRFGANITIHPDMNYAELKDEHCDVWDAESEFRCFGVPTDLPADYSRNYECERVAHLMPSGKWVSWLYWHGGGKHSEPDAIDWISDACYVNCVEKEEIVTTRTFTEKAT